MFKKQKTGAFKEVNNTHCNMWNEDVHHELEQANIIKNTTWDEDEADHVVNRSSWFRPSRNDRNEMVKHISYESMCNYADYEYNVWRRVHEDIDYTNNTLDQLRKWVEEVDVNSIVSMLQRTPRGVTTHKDYAFNPFTEDTFDDAEDDEELTYEFMFTPWQRLSMAHWSNFPYDITSSVYIDVKKITCSTQNKMPIQTQYTMLKGSFPDYSIIDLPTAAGKTAWSCSVGFMAVQSGRFQSLVEEYRMKKLGTMLQGLPEMCVARMVVIATATNTYDHYFNTVQDLIPEFKRLDPASKFLLWVGFRSNYSVEIASEQDAAVVIFWVVPIKHLNNILRATPTIAIAVCITDEFTIDTPKERIRTAKSIILKQMITQATPQSLVQATKGNTTWLKHLFLGTMIPPSDIYKYVQNHEFKKAQEGCEHLCKLDLATSTSYRKLIRKELALLIPPRLDVYFVYSRRMTLSAHIMKSSTELVPLKLPQVLLKCVTKSLREPNKEAIIQFKNSLKKIDDTSAIIDALTKLLATFDSNVVEQNSDVKRLFKRIKEFIVACPICMIGNQNTLRAFGCCGYCICDVCFDHCDNRCPFCRTSIELLPKSMVDDGDPASTDATEEERNKYDYPNLDESVIEKGTDFASRLSHYISERQKQSYNLTMCLHVLKAHAFKRILILIECSAYDARFEFDAIVNVKCLSKATTFKIYRIDQLLDSYPRKFTSIKREFDTINDEDIALISYGMDSNLLVGTNFDYVDAIITLGNLPEENLTQALGRTFRPRASRDNTRPIVMIKMHH